MLLFYLPQWEVCYLQTLGNLSFSVCFFVRCGELCSGKVKLGRKLSGVNWKCVAAVSHLGLCVWQSWGKASLYEGEVKVSLVVCPHQALKKTPACRMLALLQPWNKRYWSQLVNQCARKRGIAFLKGGTLNTFPLFCVTGKQNNWLVGSCLYAGALRAINSSRNQFKENGRREIEGDENPRCLFIFWKIMKNHCSSDKYPF